MRILSQDGRIDIPYDTTGLSIWNNHDLKFRKFRICANMRNQDGSPCILAVYSTAEKAEKAMEILRKAYSPIMVIQDQENGIEPNIKPNDFIVGMPLPTPKVEVLDNFYFRFPADDEIEV